MPHTNPWNVTDPPGTELAKNIDNSIRKLRVDIGDRFADFMVDVSADPVVLKPEYRGNVIGKQKLISFAAFNCDTSGKEAEYRAGYLLAFTDTGGMFADCDIPVGCTITKVEVLVDVGDAASAEFDLYSRPFAAGAGRPSSLAAQVSLAHISTAAGGTALMTTGVLAVVVAAGNIYYIGIEGIGAAGNSFDIFGARITYDTPDNRNTR